MYYESECSTKIARKIKCSAVTQVLLKEEGGPYSWRIGKGPGGAIGAGALNRTNTVTKK